MNHNSTRNTPLRRDVRVFISAVTKEFGTVREAVKTALLDNQVLPVEQTHFPPDAGGIDDFHRRQIVESDAVIHLVGFCYGQEPTDQPASAERRSYTQREYDLATQVHVPVYVFLIRDGFETDPHEPEDEALRQLQETYRQRLIAQGKTAHGKFFVEVASRQELDQKARTVAKQVVESPFKQELVTVDRRVTHTGRRLTGILIGLAVVALLILGVTLVVQQRQRLEAARQQQEREQQEAERLRRALAIYEQSFGPEHPKVAIRLNNLAGLLKATNRLSEAELLMRRALAIDEQSLGLEHPDVAIDLNDLAQLLKATNRLSEAEPLMRGVVTIFEKSLGANHPNVSTALNNLALLLRATDRLSEAEPLMRRALAITELSFGPEHPDVAIDLNNLALLLKETKRLSEAEPLMRRALAIDEQSFGPEHPDVARDLNNLAHLLQDTDRLPDAEPLMRRALAIDEQFGPEHPKVAIRLNNLAHLLQATNRLSEAEPLMHRSVEILQLFGQRSGHEHPELKTVVENYWDLLGDLELPADEITRRLAVTTKLKTPFSKITPEVERLLGPAQPVAEVLAKLDEQYKTEGKPRIYFLPKSERIAPHLDELLGKSRLDVPVDQPIVPHLDKLLGPAKSTQEVFAALDEQYRQAGKPRVWFLPLTEPITPHLDELLGPVPNDKSEIRSTKSGTNRTGTE